ncbi:Pkinase-domain-containing protein [Microstroma glucosiphilum]|uniref:Pkinase-domain-containing protein n=1 Tax=Pseudomicrostroma glucosiphilum TaxID=1684307 RepID=A0A316UBA9_9BASI|nr:Pkinase-domain-containing protein [Pseudomicrostroma glucosiphilum]PWN21683.1 Pkinase-domain-containing protein [Pseudomicrostroma glucosiphilum]
MVMVRRVCPCEPLLMRWKVRRKQQKKRIGHAPTGLVMAVKTIPTSPNPSVHRQILRELSFNRTCYSPYIVKYYGAFLSSDSQSIEICMEYCEAGSLDVIYKRVKSRNGRTGEKILGRVAESVLKGLHYLHDRHIIHRDIKPSNIVITREGQIKLCDFGVSGELINSLAGTFTGTSYYMAPERIKGLPYTITSDVWSLGLTILEIASNRFPFPAEGEPPLGPVDLLSYIVSMPTPELNDDPVAGIKWSRGLRDFIDRCLDKNGETRLGPKKMLTHPFIKKSEARIPPADVGKFVAEVYGWPVASSAGSDAASKAGLSAPTSTQPSVAGSATAAATPSAEEVLRLSRIPSVRKAPLNPLAAMSLSSTTTPVEAVPKMPHLPSPAAATASADHQGQSRTPTAPGMPPVERLDLEGSSTSERLAAKMRERDAGICGSPLDPELTRR